jgi:hypothetical protein
MRDSPPIRATEGIRGLLARERLANASCKEGFVIVFASGAKFAEWFSG